MAIVKEIRHGACEIYICDDYIKKDEKEIQKILQSIARIARGVKVKQQEASA